jgi:coronin-1B/1C/6
MSHFVRASKYRHVYVEPPKIDETFQGFRLSTATGEQQYIKGNTKFFAVALQGGGGPFAIVEHSKPGRMEAGRPVIGGHKGSVLDFDFNPFHEHIIASCSDDTTIKVWGIPEDGLTETITDPLVDLHGHGRKVTLLRFNPTTNNVLASISADLTMKVWDIEKGAQISTATSEGEHLLQDVVWDYFGGQYAASSKDKCVRIYDARAGGAASAEIHEAHEGAKSTKLTFLGRLNNLVTVGFTKQSQRQFKIWDPRKLDKYTKKVDIDQAAGVIIPYFDDDTNMLYLAGKGDGNIRYFECVNHNDKVDCFPLSEYRTSVAAKGVAFMPKRGLNIMKCETARALKLHSSGGMGTVEPLSFIVPRKSEAFQDDIFPPTFMGQPSQTADEWIAGANKPPVMMSLDPNAGGAKVEIEVAEYVKPKSAADLQKELDAANAEIERLKKKLADAGISA